MSSNLATTFEIVQKTEYRPLEYNDFAQRNEFERKHLTLDDLRYTLRDLVGAKGWAITHKEYESCALQAAKFRRYHPIRDYLNAAHSTHSDEGTAILDNLAAELFGCVGNNASLYNAMLRKQPHR